MKKLLFLLIMPLILSSCATILLPKQQKLTVKSDGNSKITIDEKDFGDKKTVKKQILKSGTQQVIIETPGYKKTFKVIVPERKPIAYFALLPLNIVTSGVGLLVDVGMQFNPRLYIYKKSYKFITFDEIIKRDSSSDKYMLVSNIGLNIENINRDIRTVVLKHKNTEKKLKESLSKAEIQFEDDYEKFSKIEAKNAPKKKLRKLNEVPDKAIYDDTKFSFELYKTLKSSGFVDTINRIFPDTKNTLILEAKINKITNFLIKTKVDFYYKSKVYMTWYIKNHYDEIIDSIETVEFSGDFTTRKWELIISDAVELSYLNLFQSEELKKNLKLNFNFNNTEPLQSIQKPSSPIKEKADATFASVIIKTPKGHGSGFAISNDGYIITNYHVIASKNKDDKDKIEVITMEGDTLKATLVRANEFRDLVLLKIDKKFQKAFELKNTKSYSLLSKVFTLGAPRYMELSQSASKGIISSERKVNNNDLIQLGMSVNSGNSGGPLFDENGNLQGVIVSKLIGYNTEGVCFAIPGYLIQEYLNINYK